MRRGEGPAARAFSEQARRSYKNATAERLHPNDLIKHWAIRHIRLTV
jgi:hypothetical protein